MHLAHSGLENPEHYVPGMPRDYVARRYGLDPADIAKLGSAENPLGPSPAAVAAVTQAVGRIDRYASWTAEPLRNKLAEACGVGDSPDWFICGAGETELISLAIRAFCEPGGAVLMPGPCFPVYHLFAEAEGRRAIIAHESTLRPSMSIDPEAYAAAVRPGVRIVFVTNPHSPSGTWLAEPELRYIIETCAAAGALVVLDEAYVHYSGTDGHIHLARDYDHLLVLRTFSKAFGLAGLRVGFGMARPAVISALMAVKPVWNIGQLQIAGAVAALSDTEHVNTTVRTVAASRDYVQDRFDRELDRFRMVPGSRSNFFLVKIVDSGTDSTSVFNGLLERGVIVKDGSVNFRGLADRFLRVDIGLRPSMDRLVDALKDLP